MNLFDAILTRNIASFSQVDDIQASLDAVDETGRTALVLAIEQRFDAAVDEFLRRGADPEKRDRRGAAPILVATMTNNLSVVQSLVAHGVNINDPATCALFVAQSPEMVDLMMSLGADVNLRNSTGETALHCAIWGRNSSTRINKLIEHGAEMNVKNQWGCSPLVSAASDAGGEQSCVTLLEHGAEWNPPPNETEWYNRQLTDILDSVGRLDLIEGVVNNG